jgi:hypothetical protein
MDNGRIKVLYIAGFGRNGGTLLDRILGQISGFFSLGEFRFVWEKGVLGNELCNCKVPFRNCSFWTAVFQRAFGGFDEVYARDVTELYHRVDRTRYVPLLISPWKPSWYRGNCELYAGILERLYVAIKEESQCRVLVDSSKFAGYGLILNMIPSVDLYVVHLVRDSRGAAFSWQKRKRKPEVQSQIEYVPQYSPLSSSLQWAYRNISAELLKPYAKGYLLLRYENLASEPRESVCRIASLLDEPVNELPFIDSVTVRLGESHMQSGNPMRFQQGRIAIHLDNEWETKMKRSDKALVTALTWPLLTRYGYLRASASDGL